MEYTVGCKLEKKDPRDFLYEHISGGVQEIPDSFVLQDVPKMYQNGMDCCVGSTIAVIKSMQEAKIVSQRHIFSHGKKKENYFGWGTYFSYCMSGCDTEGILNWGTLNEDVHMDREQYMRITLKDEWKEEAARNRSNSYWRVAYGAEDIDALKLALLKEKNPLATSMMWKKEYNNPIDGFIPIGSEAVGGHMFPLKGWELIDFNGGKRERLVFQNHWGENWGDNGDFYVWSDELALYNMRSFYAIKDIPKDKAYILANYNNKLVRNQNHPAHYYVSAGKIVWIENEEKFYFGRDASFWGDWNDTVIIEDDAVMADLQTMYDLIF